ncbi:hypothetical protein LEMLEM_LOCUS19848 [Lemmus lemmus]
MDMEEPSSGDGWGWRRSPHWSTGLSSQGPDEERKEGEHEQGRQDHEGCAHLLRCCDLSKGSSGRPAGLGLNEHVIGLYCLMWLT